MKKTVFALAGTLFFPAVAFAQMTLNTFFTDVLVFIDNVLIPFMFGVAFLIFIINAIRFFVVQSNNQEGRENARSLVMYSLLAFVLLIVFLGIINMLTSSLGLDGCTQPISDYEAYVTGVTPTPCP